ncbi:hypothetical protein L7F22_010854 [Adiantum nelumboides]|nr:hypothetical protein [Adiantum nelumboides]
MEYCPGSTSIYGSMHEASAINSLPYTTVAMDSFCSYLPQPSSAAMEDDSPVAIEAGYFISEEETDNAAQSVQLYMNSSILQQQQLNSYIGEATLPSQYVAEANAINMACMHDVSTDLMPNWESFKEANSTDAGNGAALVNDGAGIVIEEEQVQSLLALQAILQNQYGLALTLEQLLALDALPALLHADNPPQDAEAEDKPFDNFTSPVLEPCSFNLTDPHYSLHAKHGDLLAPQLSHDHAPLSSQFCAPLDPFKSPDVSSPGSGTSSVLTDTDSSDKPLPPLECTILHAPLPFSPYIPTPLPFVITPPFFNNAKMPWLSGRATVKRGACTALEEDLEIIEPPAQRRKLHGITLEQVLQAEKLQHTATPLLAHATVNNPLFPDMGAELASSVDMGLCEVRSDFARKHASTSTFKLVDDVQSQSVAARKRRHKIKEKTERLKVIIPGATRLDTASTFDLAIKYVDFLQAQMVCLENEVSLTQQRASHNINMLGNDQESFKRALIHRLLSSQDVQHFLSKEGLCIVTESLASRLNFDPNSLCPTPARQVI